MRGLLILVVLVGLGVQAPTPQEPEPGHGLPYGHFCTTHADPQKPVEHQCACKLSCSKGEHGEIVTREDTTCKAYCTRERCACHADEMCEPDAAG